MGRGKVGRCTIGRPASPGYRADCVEVMNRLLGNRTDVTLGKMFGFPAFYTGGKLFACVYGDGVGLKLPEQVVQGLQGNPGITPFRPYGRPKMKGWIHIRPDGAGMSTLNSGLLDASIAFVRRLAKPSIQTG